jgi:hypothetical protein
MRRHPDIGNVLLHNGLFTFSLFFSFYSFSCALRGKCVDVSSFTLRYCASVLAVRFVMLETIGLYQISWSHFCDKVRWALGLKGLPFKRTKIYH